jgi:hypothetical protein
VRIFSKGPGGAGAEDQEHEKERRKPLGARQVKLAFLGGIAVVTAAASVVFSAASLIDLTRDQFTAVAAVLIAVGFEVFYIGGTLLEHWLKSEGATRRQIKEVSRFSWGGTFAVMAILITHAATTEGESYLYVLSLLPLLVHLALWLYSKADTTLASEPARHHYRMVRQSGVDTVVVNRARLRAEELLAAELADTQLDAGANIAAARERAFLGLEKWQGKFAELTQETEPDGARHRVREALGFGRPTADAETRQDLLDNLSSGHWALPQFGAVTPIPALPRGSSAASKHPTPQVSVRIPEPTESPLSPLPGDLSPDLSVGENAGQGLTTSQQYAMNLRAREQGWEQMTLRQAVATADSLIPGMTAPMLSLTLGHLGVAATDSSIRSTRSALRRA